MNFKAIAITAWIWFPALATAHDTYSETYLVCKSPECIERAKLLNESLNTTMYPCTDFYSYVCSQWESAHQPLGPSFSYDVYEDIGKNISEKLTYILGNRSVVENNQTIIDKITIMYNACLALPDGRDALITVLNESGFNDWPILTEENIFNSSNCTDLLRHMDISAIFYVNLENMKEYAQDPANPYKMHIQTMPVQKKIMKEPNIRAVINNTIKFLNPDINTSVLQNLTNQLAKFAEDLSKIQKESSAPYSIATLEETFGTNIPISDLLMKEFRKVNITLNNTDKVQVYHRYYGKLSMFLKTAIPNTFYNYAGLLAIYPYIQYANMSTEEASQSTTKSRSWNECIDLLDKSASDILDYLYVTNNPNHSTIKNEVGHIARRLKQAFNETIQNNSWIDNTTREGLAKKLKEVPLEIGYPETLLNMSVLETRYKYVPSFSSDISFTEALYYIKENLYKMQLRKLRYPEEGNLGWDHRARDVRRPFHDKYGTKIEIPFALLVPPFFQEGLPRSLNYGGIGGAIARELGQCFSTAGIGNIIGRPYRGPMSQESLELFKNRTSCFVKQYEAANRKVLPDLSAPTYFWSQTLDEDLADNTGLRMAFKAYIGVLLEECGGIDTRLPSLESFSGMRLFFISYARTMCKIADNATLMQEIRHPQYSPAQNRVNIAMINMEEFAKALNCSLGSPMHPPQNETCSMW